MASWLLEIHRDLDLAAISVNGPHCSRRSLNLLNTKGKHKERALRAHHLDPYCRPLTSRPPPRGTRALCMPTARHTCSTSTRTWVTPYGISLWKRVADATRPFRRGEPSKRPGCGRVCLLPVGGQAPLAYGGDRAPRFIRAVQGCTRGSGTRADAVRLRDVAPSA